MTLPRWWPAALLLVLGIAVLLYGHAQREIGASRAETKQARQSADSAKAVATVALALYDAAKADSQRVADSLANLKAQEAAHLAALSQLRQTRADLRQALKRDSTTADSLKTTLATVAVLDSSLAASEAARRSDSLQVLILTADRNMWRRSADSSARALTRANDAIRALTVALDHKRSGASLGEKLLWTAVGFGLGQAVH